MLWDPWSKVDRQGLARYISPEVVQWLVVPENRTDLLAQRDGRYRLVRAIYRAVQHRSIRYAPERYELDEAVQAIRTAHELLVAPREGTCLDLALLFCG